MAKWPPLGLWLLTDVSCLSWSTKCSSPCTQRGLGSQDPHVFPPLFALHLLPFANHPNIHHSGPSQDFKGLGNGTTPKPKSLLSTTKEHTPPYLNTPNDKTCVWASDWSFTLQAQFSSNKLRIYSTRTKAEPLTAAPVCSNTSLDVKIYLCSIYFIYSIYFLYSI